MNRVRTSITSVSLAFLIAACSSSEPETQDTQPGTGGNATSTGSASGGTKSTNTDKASGGKQSTTAKASTGKGGNTGTSSDGGTTDDTEGGNSSGGTASGSKASGTTSNGGSSGGKSGSASGGAAGGTKASGSSGAGGQGGVATATTTTVEVPPVVTSAEGAYWKVGTVTDVTSGTADITVSDSGSQAWTGFGGTFNEAGWDALAAVSDGDRTLALQLLYDPALGANFAYGRLPIGASDYAMSEYTLNDNAGDTSMSKFSITRDEEKLIPYIKAAMLVRPDIKFWASPWTPPAWMKNNNSLHAAESQNAESEPQGSMKGDDANLTAYAKYLEKYVQEYEKVGIKVSAIHPQNEPGYGNPYPSCYWTSANYIKFIRDFLGPLFKTDLPSTEIWGGTLSAQSDGTIGVNLSKDSKAMGYVKGFGLQWNTKDKISALKGAGVPIMQTEHKCGNYSFASDYWDQSRYSSSMPQNDYAYGVESFKNIRDWVKAGVNSYSAWNMVLDTAGTNLNKNKPWHQNALLVVDRSAKKLIQTPAYFVFRHLSQYVQLPATVVGTNSDSALAFKSKDGSYVVVIFNEGAAKKMTVSAGGKKVQFDMPGNGWATVNVKG